MTIYPGGPQDGTEYVGASAGRLALLVQRPLDTDYVGMAYFTGLDSPDIREAIDPRSGWTARPRAPTCAARARSWAPLKSWRPRPPTGTKSSRS